MVIEVETSTAKDLQTLAKLEDWANNPINRFAFPYQPQLVDPLTERDAQLPLLRTQLEQNLDLARLLLESYQSELQSSAVLLFDSIIAAGGMERLERICHENSEAAKIWAAFAAAAALYSMYRLQIAEAGLRSTVGAGARQPQLNSILTVIVHGTLAAGNDWWRESGKPGNFWEYIDSKTGDCVTNGKEFSWSGGPTEGERRLGAELFIRWWQQQQKPRLRVIAHSHGSNVVWQALALEPALKVETYIALGTPICISYPLRLGQIRTIKNLYSRNDWVQVPGSKVAGARGEGRTLPDSAQVANYHIPEWDPRIAGVRGVSHSDLHDKDVWNNHRLDKLL